MSAYHCQAMGLGGGRAMRTRLLWLLFVSGCALPGGYYTPKPSTCRPPAVQVPNTKDAQACARTCTQTHEICRGNCKMAYTQYNGREIEKQVQACHDKCDDDRDGCLKGCS